MSMRIGHGYDVHALVKGRRLVLGGVEIPYARGLQGHSDADALLHAICDACLGAAALGDLGRHFPDTDARYAGVDSRLLLREVRDKLAARGWFVSNVDATVVAQAPRLAPHIERMTENVANDLRISPDRVNVKATTSEHLGALGRGEGIAAHAVVLLVTAGSDASHSA